MLDLDTLLLCLVLAAASDPAKNAAPSSSRTPSSSYAAHDPPMPPNSEIVVGDRAPDFACETLDGRPMRFHEVHGNGPVLLVFGASEAQLARIQQERDALIGLGVVPVAVVERGPVGARALARRLALGYLVLPDFRRVIAAQFNAVQSGAAVPSWFVIDPRGRVRALKRGRLPGEGYPQLCARALGLPLPGGVLPARR